MNLFFNLQAHQFQVAMITLRIIFIGDVCYSTRYYSEPKAQDLIYNVPFYFLSISVVHNSLFSITFFMCANKIS